MITKIPRKKYSFCYFLASWDAVTVRRVINTHCDPRHEFWNDTKDPRGTTPHWIIYWIVSR